MPFYTFETKDKNVENKVFLARLTFSQYDEAMAGKPNKAGFRKGKNGPVHPDTETPVKSWRRLSDSVNIQFAQPWESSKWDSFEYRAGYNMMKAKRERMNAEAKSHMGSNPIQEMERVEHGVADLGAHDINNYEGQIT